MNFNIIQAGNMSGWVNGFVTSYYWSGLPEQLELMPTELPIIVYMI